LHVRQGQWSEDTNPLGKNDAGGPYPPHLPINSIPRCDNTLVFLFLDVTRLASIIVLICEKSTQLAINKLELG
jgi:hypothetical protein